MGAGAVAVCGALIALLSRAMPDRLRADTLAVQGLIGAAFLAFILLTSNPFARVADPPWQGRDLNPILQDPGLAIHPPLLYLGYVGFSIVFSFAAAALIGGRIDAAWARFVRPWTLLAWIFLTLGIAMGSYWAYYTLGWGGFWFWDPVENASLMPWLAGTALLHCAAVMEKREALKVWTIFLAILAFSLSLLGTFLVRSGVLTSVHAFASDPERGVFILAILVFFIGGALALFALRASALPTGGLFAPISREGALVVNNLLLTDVLRDRRHRHALSARAGGADRRENLGRRALLQHGADPDRSAAHAADADRADARLEARRSRRRLAAAARGLRGGRRRAGGFRRAAMARLSSPCSRAGLAVYLVVGAFTDIAQRAAPRGNAAALALARSGLPLSAWGTAVAHAGIGLTLLGLAATGWGVEQIVAMKPGVAYDGRALQNRDRGCRVARRPQLLGDLCGDGGAQGRRETIARIEPAKRFYQARRMARTEAGIVTLGLGQVYAALGEQHEDGTLDARLYYKPLVLLIWLGARGDGARRRPARWPTGACASASPRARTPRATTGGGVMRMLSNLAGVFLLPLAGEGAPRSGVG